MRAEESGWETGGSVEGWGWTGSLEERLYGILPAKEVSPERGELSQAWKEE